MIYKIFNENNRSDLVVSGYSESIYSYLNRSSSHSAERVRKLIETWFSHYPVNEQDELLRRLQSSDDQELCSAFYELYIYEMLSCLEFEIQIHPKLNGDTRKKPDFIVYKSGKEFYLEAVITHELKKKEIIGQKINNITLDKIDEIGSKDFFAHIRIIGFAKSQIPSRKVKEEIRKWFETINHEHLTEIYFAYGIKGMPTRSFDFDGVHFNVIPIPKNLSKGKSQNLIGSQSNEFRLINTESAIRKAIKDKSSRYGKLGRPYLLAINVMSISCENDDVMGALFGSEQYIFDQNAPIEMPPNLTRTKDGAWSLSKGTRLSGVLITRNLTPWTVSYQETTLYINPWAEYPIMRENIQLPIYEPHNDGVMYKVNGIHPREIFKLANNWPENLE